MPSQCRSSMYTASPNWRVLRQRRKSATCVSFSQAKCYVLDELLIGGGDIGISQRASVALGYKVSPTDGNGFKLHEVRRVAPTKLMFCLSFRLPKEVAFFGA